jgi:hypothetical protein
MDVLTLIGPDNDHGADIRIDTVEFVCMSMPRVVALVINKHFVQTWAAMLV